VIVLRPYQTDIIDRVRVAYREGSRATCVQLPTGGGKTVLFGKIASGAADRGTRTCFGVHRQELIDQTSKTLSKFGIPHGIIAADYSPDPSQLIQIGSIPTMIRRLERLPAFDLLTFDETHHLVADSWRKVLDYYPGAKVLGLTATPCRLDGRGLGDHYDTLICGPSTSELVEQGFLCPTVTFAPQEAVDLSRVKTVAGDFDKKEVAKIMGQSKIVGDAVAHYRQLADRQPAIAFCASIEHSQAVAAQFRDAGYSAAHVDGDTNKDDRRRIVASFARGEINVLSNCGLFTEGFDVPGARALIGLRPTQSLSLWLQMIGRIMRVDEGKERAIILDHAGNSARHGLPTDAREWTLEGRKRSKKADAGPPIRQCGTCFAINPAAARACLACGATFASDPRTVRQVEGSLVEVGARKWADPTMAWLASSDLRACLKWAKTEEQLHMVAKARGYSPGWVGHRIRERNAWRAGWKAKAKGERAAALV